VEHKLRKEQSWLEADMTLAKARVFRPMAHAGQFMALCVILQLLTGCATSKPDSIDLMPAPDIYALGDIDPFSSLNPSKQFPYRGILYATDRAPAENGSQFFQNEPGNLLRVGIGHLQVGKENFTWEEARRISLLKNRAENYPLAVSDIERIGIIDRSINVFTDPALIPEHPEKARERFIDLINQKLALSTRKDIYIYVHGYKVGFENPILVSAELWHFLGYDGVFIADAWPSTPAATLAYASDLEAGAISANYLSMLIQLLAQDTIAEHIHVIGYSAGTRVVLTAMYQLALLYDGVAQSEIREKLKVGHVILVGSDFARQFFGLYLANGLLNVTEKLTVYMSKTDMAMGMSRFIFRRERLGTMWDEGELPRRTMEALALMNGLELINVTGAEGAATGNGHAYFRKSPWVSSDVLMTLMYDLVPEQRGLVKSPESPVWRFPEDYVQRFLSELKRTNPELFQK